MKLKMDVVSGRELIRGDDLESSGCAETLQNQKEETISVCAKEQAESR